MCQCRFTNRKKSTTLAGMIMGGGYACVGTCGNALYLLLNFAMTLKLL